MHYTSQRARVVALASVVLLSVAVLLTPMAMLIGAMVLLRIILKLTSSQQAQMTSAEYKAYRRRLAHEASQAYMRRFAAPAGAAGRVGSGMMKRRGDCAARNGVSRFAYNARDQDWSKSGFGGRTIGKRHVYKSRDQPLVVA